MYDLLISSESLDLLLFLSMVEHYDLPPIQGILYFAFCHFFFLWHDYIADLAL